MTCPGPHLSASLGSGRSGPWVYLAGSTRAAPSQEARAEPASRVSGPRDTPCTVLLPPHPRPSPQSRSSWELGGSGWGPPATAPGTRRGGRLGPPRRLGDREGAGCGPRRPPPRRTGSSGSARPTAALPHPPSEPPRKRRLRGSKPAPRPQRRGAHTHSHSVAEPHPVRQPRPLRTWRPSPGLSSGSRKTLEERAAAAAAPANCASCPGPCGPAPRRRPHPQTPPQRPRPAAPTAAEGRRRGLSLPTPPLAPPCSRNALRRRKKEGGACPPVVLAVSAAR